MAAQSTMSAPRAAWSAERARYTTVAVVLHWVIAVMIGLQLYYGFQIGEALQAEGAEARAAAFEMVQTHKSFGLTVLALTVLRVTWRLWRPAPPAPTAMPAWQRAASAGSHLALYAFMLALPLTGWAMSSVSVAYGDLPTFWFGLFEIPHLPGLTDLPIETRRALDAAFHAAHFWLGAALIGLLALHVAAALKHHIVDGDVVLARMTPGVSARRTVLEEPLGWARSGFQRFCGSAVLVAAGLGVGWLYLGDEAMRRAGDLHAEMFAVEDASAPASGDAVAGAQGSDAPRWSVVAEESAIRFSGLVYGAPFAGSFEAWTADIAFDPEAPETARIRVEIEAASAATGNAQYDGALTGAGWLDAGGHSTAIFEASSARAAEDGGYVAVGELTLRGVSAPIELPFALAIVDGRAEMTATLEIDRLAFDVGAAPDATGGVVSLAIPVDIRVVALREPGS